MGLGGTGGDGDYNQNTGFKNSKDLIKTKKIKEK